MIRAALGIRMHSGWGVIVAVSGDASSLEVRDRRRFITTDPSISRASQPYHYAKNLELPDAESYLANCAAVSERLASAAIGEVVRELDGNGYQIVGSAVLLASGRPLPPLAKILASHALIHTAEGELFRKAVTRACEHLNIAVVAIRERELDERSKTAFGNAASAVRRRISNLGSSVGLPWTKDHKAAALAASMILAGPATMHLESFLA